MNKDVYVEIDTNVISCNIKNIIHKYHDYQYYIGVVKGNCYGHGIGLVQTMIDSGINYLAVSTIEEALDVRKVTSVPILCMQPIALQDVSIASSYNITITISSYHDYQEIIKQDAPLKIHLKLNTGMNRLGIDNKDEVRQIYQELEKKKNIYLEGIFTHIQTTGMIDGQWDRQIKRFQELTSLIDLKAIDMVHIYSTNSVVLHPKLPFCNGVRLGILMYGIAPQPIKYQGLVGTLKKIKHRCVRQCRHLSPLTNDYQIAVKPAFKLISRIIEINEIKAGEYIGYGLKYQTKSNVRIGVVSIGYADGLPLLHSGLPVYINNRVYQIVGSINMKMITVKIDERVRVGDKVIIINDNIRSICLHDHMTPHCLLTTIPQNIERMYK